MPVRHMFRARTLVACLFAAALLLAPGTTKAIDFRTRGVWISMLEYGNGGNFVSRDRQGKGVTGWGRWGEDEFEAKTRVRLQLDAVGSENLSGSVYFEIGAFAWGRASKGGALGGDGAIVKVKGAWLDWAVPGTKIKTRMGLQRIHLPDYSSEASQVFDADVAGVSVNVPVSEHLGLTAFWARPFNDNWGGAEERSANYLDNVDLFALTLPMTFEGVRITPWAMVGIVGENAFRSSNSGKYYDAGYGGGISPAAYMLDGRDNALSFGTAFWAGITGEVTAADPFRLAWTFNYGSFETGEKCLNRRGWHASLLAEYRLDWGTPGIYGWYSSGDDGNIKNGSERMPSLDYNNESTSGFSGFGQLGTWTIGRDAVLGFTLAGTWGIGARLKDISFMDKLKTTLRVNLYNGTNDAEMARHIKTGAAGVEVPSATYNGYTPDFYSANPNGIYLTEKDYAMEFGMMTTWQIYENLRLLVEANYIALWLDQSSDVWGGFRNAKGQWVKANSVENCWNVNVSFIYRF